MARPFVVMRFDAPTLVNQKLHVLSAQVGTPIRELMLDAISLLLRYHQIGEGIPQPPVRRPLLVPTESDVAEEEVVVEEETFAPSADSTNSEAGTLNGRRRKP